MEGAALRLDGRLGEYLGFSQRAVNQGDCYSGDTGTLQDEIAHRNSSIHYRMVMRCILALVNEGAKILQEGIALRASDIDVVYLTGYGFPPYRGGPMHHADSLGLYNVVRSMRRLAKNPHGDGAAWEPAPVLAKLAAEGKSFSGSAS